MGRHAKDGRGPEGWRMAGWRMTRLAGVMLAALLWSGAAMAVPCGDVALEGRCDGLTRRWCNAGALHEEQCADCCAFSGTKYQCVALSACPTGGACVEECLDGPDVFGCSLLNTHAWTCEVGAGGCTRRRYVPCGAGEVCDEADTHTCRPRSEVDLCGGVPASGKCDDKRFKRCVAGQIETEDCGAAGQSCVAGVGCSAVCPVECTDGESGCSGAGQAWDCTLDLATGCWVQAAKNCAAGKACYEGRCRFQSEIDDLEAQKAPDGSLDDDLAAPAPASEGAEGCGVVAMGRPAEESALLVVATLLGFLLMTRIARRHRPKTGRRGERGRKSCGVTGQHPSV